MYVATYFIVLIKTCIFFGKSVANVCMLSSSLNLTCKNNSPSLRFQQYPASSAFGVCKEAVSQPSVAEPRTSGDFPGKSHVVGLHYCK